MGVFRPFPSLLPDVAAALRTVLRDPDLDPTLDTSLDAIPGWDSMDLIAVVVELECRFGIQFDLPELESFSAVGDLVRGVATKCSRQVA
jgi:acyl carrier protein